MATKTVKGRVRRAVKRPAARPKRHQPESLRLRLVTPAMTVNDLQKSIAFYTDGLGFLIEDRWDDKGVLLGVSLKAGTARLMLNQDDFKKGSDRVKGVGQRLWLSTAQDIDALAQRIKGKGLTLGQEPVDMPWGSRVFSLADPDGFVISFTRERRST